MILERDKKPPAPYVHQDYPKVLNGPNRSHRKVKNKEEEDALGPAWQLPPHPPEGDPAVTAAAVTLNAGVQLPEAPAPVPTAALADETAPLTPAQKAAATKAAKAAAKDAAQPAI